MADPIGVDGFDAEASRARCRRYRRRILDVSQQVGALHMAAAFSCMEMVDVVYNGLVRREADGSSPDTFLMSKGHGCLAQYMILEDRGTLTRQDLDLYCKAGGRLGCHPDYGVPGIEASTGSLGHGLAISVGMAYAEVIRRGSGRVYCVLSDGELQEGSTWEAMLLASSLGTTNLIACVDNNDFQSLGRTSQTHPSFYPVLDKLVAFGWEAAEVDGHDAAAVFAAVASRQGGRPFVLVARTTKGKGVSYMENVPIWHYRSPTPAEYEQAIREVEGTS